MLKTIAKQEARDFVRQYVTEHARIFHFAAGHEDPVAGESYIGSAHWMHRNLSNRIEVITPVSD